MCHKKGSNKYYKHYFQSQSAIDIQGLVTHGFQTQTLPLLQSLPCKNEVDLTKTEELAALEGSNKLKKLCKTCNKLREQLLQMYVTWEATRKSQSNAYQETCLAMAKVSYQQSLVPRDDCKRKGKTERQDKLVKAAASVKMLDDLVDNLNKEEEIADLLAGLQEESKGLPNACTNG